LTLAECRWNEPGGTVAAQTIACFLETIGIAVQVGAVDGTTFLSGLAIRQGAIWVDPAAAAWPGDLLHEAGHIAVTQPERRAALGQPEADGGEEMAAIAWSVAAAQVCGVRLEVLFHPAGYKGGSDNLIADWEAGQPFGVPLLTWYGMTSAETYPAMTRWLR
jgi:hypothetical protein